METSWIHFYSLNKKGWLLKIYKIGCLIKIRSQYDQGVAFPSVSDSSTQES